MLKFITGNHNKFIEVEAVLDGHPIEQLDIDLPEIQDLDPHKIIRAKLQEALRHHEGEFIVEDTSLYLDCLNGLPGPLIKWFLESLGTQGIADLAHKMGNTGAQAKTIIGYSKSPNEIQYFEGVLEGQIVNPRGSTNFGWNPIFQPKGHDLTFGEMTPDEKNAISMRKIAAAKLKAALEQKS